MDPQVTSALIGGAFNTFSQGMGSIFQRKQNNIQRDYEREMYQRSVDDNRKNWEMANLYNSPEQQMARLKAAGLNPNLVYGTGATAMGSDISSQSPHVSDLSKNQTPYMQGISQGIGNMVSSIYDLRIKSAQANLLQEEAKTQQSNRNLQAAEANLKNLLANKTSLEISLGKDTYNQKVKEAQLTLDKMGAEITNINTNTNTQTIQQDKMVADIKATLDNNTREWQKQNLSLNQMRAQTAKIIQDTLLSKAQLGLTQQNISLAKIENLVKDATKEYDVLYSKNKSQMSGHELDFMEKGYTINSGAIDQILKELMQALGQNRDGRGKSIK